MSSLHWSIRILALVCIFNSISVIVLAVRS
jgi:hypothetical protein